MRFDVRALPRTECAIQGSKRAGKEYNAAVDELAGEVYASAPRAEQPFNRPHLTIVAFVGSGESGYFRPQSPKTLWPALDGVFLGLKRAGLTDEVPVVTVAVLTGCDTEGLQITIEELEEAGQ